jgi:hypothetical protein
LYLTLSTKAFILPGRPKPLMFQKKPIMFSFSSDSFLRNYFR